MKIKKISTGDAVFIAIIAISISAPMFNILRSYLSMEKALYITGLVFWFAVGIQIIITLLHKIITHLNGE